MAVHAPFVDAWPGSNLSVVAGVQPVVPGGAGGLRRSRSAGEGSPAGES